MRITGRKNEKTRKAKNKKQAPAVGSLEGRQPQLRLQPSTGADPVATPERFTTYQQWRLSILRDGQHIDFLHGAYGTDRPSKVRLSDP